MGTSTTLLAKLNENMRLKMRGEGVAACRKAKTNERSLRKEQLLSGRTSNLSFHRTSIEKVKTHLGSHLTMS